MGIFGGKYRDLPDYIIGVTKEIWEERGIATLRATYSPEIVVRSPASVVVGNETVIAATMATLAEFPDRALLAEDVIWSGEEASGMLSSHRIYSTATHSSDGVYGAASGTKLGYRIIADCHARNGVIDDEWIIRDQGAIVRQLGHTPHEYARAQIQREVRDSGAARRPFEPSQNVSGAYRGGGNDSEWGAMLVATLQRMMNADFSTTHQDYDRAARLHYSGGVEARGGEGANAHWLGLRASFPSAKFTAEHVIGREDRLMPPRASVRWSLDGRHDGWGTFGAPSNAMVHVMGFTHVDFGPFAAAGREASIRAEYTLIDETAVWKQILLGSGNH